jgi:hypothetical protein
LFRTLKSERLVVTNPTDRVRVVKPNQTTPNRLTPESLQLIGRAAAQTPPCGSCSLLSVSTRSGLDKPDCSPWNSSICPTPASMSAAPPGQWTRSPADAIGQYLAYRHNR